MKMETVFATQTLIPVQKIQNLCQKNTEQKENPHKDQKSIFFLRNPFKPFQKLPRNLKIALLNPHWHEL